MSKVTVEESSLLAIGNAIRGKNGGNTAYKPSEMASAISAIPNSYTAGDEGKVVSSGMLVVQTARSSQITANGTYDTTNNNSVTVNVAGSYTSYDNTSF